jgi:PEP-CTERM motif
MTSIQRLAVALSMIALSAPALAVPAAVPEPGTFGLMAVGVVALVAASFRKRR